MRPISETCNRARNIVELVNILPYVSLKASETELDYH